MKLKQLLFLYFFLLLSISLYAQHNGQLIEQSLDLKIPFTITQFSTKDGLPQSQVLDIVSKKNGNLFIATVCGIVEYKGGTFNLFLTNDEYKDQVYTKLFWNENWQRLYGKGANGTIYLLYPKYETVCNYTAITLTHDSLYYINTDGVIYTTHVANTSFKKLVSTGIKNANSLYYDSGTFFIGAPKGIFKYNLSLKTRQQITTKTCELFKKNPYNNYLYALGQKEINILKDSFASKVFDLKKFNDDVQCQQIAFTDANDFYVTTTDGLFEITPSYTDHYAQNSAFPSLHLLAIYYNAAENCLFVGTGEKGMLKLQFKNCYSFSSEHGFGKSSSLSSIIQTKSGEVLALEPSGIIYKMRADTALSYFLMKGPGGSLTEINDQLYVGTWNNGLIIVKDKKIIDVLSSPENLPGNRVKACFKDSRGKIWMGTNKGLARGSTSKDTKPFLTETVKSSVITFTELRNGDICIGTSEGVFIFDEHDNLLVHLGKKEGLLGKEVRSFYEDAEGKLWIGTYGGGLYCYFMKKLTSINKMKNAHLNEDAFCLAKDEFGYLYITSNHGLWRIREKDLSDFYYKKLNYLIPFHYEEEAGILNTEFNGGFQNNFLKTKLNHFYFPTLQGILVVAPEKPTFRKLEPVIDEIIVNDEIINKKKRVLERKSFSIEFKFSSTTFLSKYNVFYQYKLEGQNPTEWSPLDKSTSVTYKLIPPGSYTFSVRAIDAFNDPSPRLCTYAFEVKPYFYETLWFKVSAFCSFILLTSLIARYRVQRYRKKAEEKEKVQRQVAELKLQAIQAQMNPHFIFNSLNSVKYYLSLNDQSNADKYIDHFSTLLRNFMENGSKSFITIDDEIKMLIPYLELEKQRMNPSFDFKVEIKGDLHNKLIPTHLIQPFIENAIKHGINHSATKCELLIKLSEIEGAILCVIEDNGIGRKKSQEINTKRPYHHTSKGIEIVSEKIRVVKEIYNIDIQLTINDGLSSSLNGNGTIVTLHIPIK